MFRRQIVLTARNAFPRTARLLAAADFAAVFASPVRQQSAWFRVQALRRSDDNARIGLAVSRKVSTRAVARNRLRRLARELFRLERASLAGWDLVVMAKPAAVVAGLAELRADLARLYARIAALNTIPAAGTMAPLSRPAPVAPESQP